uniref:Uncharacterized protein n=1 Tax=Arundo donax TaxID=35708 RepID=A0A0A9GJY8_ARUDO
MLYTRISKSPHMSINHMKRHITG